MRLVGGRVDPGGFWEYGRLQVFQGSSFVGVSNFISSNFLSSLVFGRREAQVACRSLGYGSGAVLLSGALSGLPGDDSTLYEIEAINCGGLEDTLSDCTTASEYLATDYRGSDYGDSYVYDYGIRGSPVALLCTTSSGALCLTLSTSC